MTRHRICTSLLAAPCLIVACHTAPPATAPAPGTPQSFAGCYHVDVGPWTRTGAHMGLTPPSEFRLDTALAKGARAPGSVPRRVTAVSPVTDVGFSSWGLAPGDTVVVGWSNGFAGAVLRLAVREDSLSGIAMTFSDARTGFPDPTAPARGRRIGCADSVR